MTSGGSGASLSYDPLMRLHQVAGTATTQFGWDDTDLIAEYDGAGALQRRYVMDPGDPAGQPVVWYEGSGTSDRRFLSADERGSIVSVTDGTGALLGINRYDEFGQPQSTNPSTGSGGPFGRFGYADSPNLYQYVLNDPVNLGDPLGLAGACDIQRVSSCADIVVMGGFGGSSGAGGGSGGGSGGSPGWGIVNQAGDPVDRGWWKNREPVLIETPKPTDPPVIVSAKHPRIPPTGSSPFYFNGERFYADPLYEKPWYSNYVDACFVLCPPVVGLGAALVGPEGGAEALFGRGTGLLNQNRWFRVGRSTGREATNKNHYTTFRFASGGRQESWWWHLDIPGTRQ